MVGVVIGSDDVVAVSIITFAGVVAGGVVVVAVCVAVTVTYVVDWLCFHDCGRLHRD